MCFYCGNRQCRSGRVCGSEVPRARLDYNLANFYAKDFCEEMGFDYDEAKDLKRQKEIADYIENRRRIMRGEKPDAA